MVALLNKIVRHLEYKIPKWYEKITRHFFLCIFRIFPIKRDVILFESYPELDGSPWMMYREMVNRGYGEKYKLLWAVDKSFTVRSDVRCIPFWGGLSCKQKFSRLYYTLCARLIVDSNRPIYKKNPKTIRIYTRHGGPLKKAPGYIHSCGKMDYMLSLSQDVQKIDFAEYKNYCVKKIDDIVLLGFPTNDRLFDGVDLFKNGFYPALNSSCMQNSFKKVIGWLPTFRQHREGNRVDSEKVFPFGVPLIQTEEELCRMNQVLQENNILLVIQMHHAQMANFSKKKFSNVVLVDQNLKYKVGVSTANLMHSFDALITDYSAAYHEYVMLDRPIALSIDDYELYASKTGFMLDYFEWIKGVYLKNTTDLLHFIEEVANGVDSAKIEREAAMHRIHKYIDNKSTQRVVDFIVEKAKL